MCTHRSLDIWHDICSDNGYLDQKIGRIEYLGGMLFLVSSWIPDIKRPDIRSILLPLIDKYPNFSLYVQKVISASGLRGGRTRPLPDNLRDKVSQSSYFYSC